MVTALVTMLTLMMMAITYWMMLIRSHMMELLGLTLMETVLLITQVHHHSLETSRVVQLQESGKHLV